MTESKLIRVDEDFKNVLKDISLERIKKGIDKEIKSTKRLTKAILRHSDWKNIKKDLLIKPLIIDKIIHTGMNSKNHKLLF